MSWQSLFLQYFAFPVFAGFFANIASTAVINSSSHASAPNQVTVTASAPAQVSHSVTVSNNNGQINSGEINISGSNNGIAISGNNNSANLTKIDANPFPESITYDVLQPSIEMDPAQIPQGLPSSFKYLSSQIHVAVRNSPYKSGNIVWNPDQMRCIQTDSPPITGRGGVKSVQHEATFGTVSFPGVSLTHVDAYFKCISANPIIAGVDGLFSWVPDK